MIDILIDEPTLSAPLEEWEEHLANLKKLPSDEVVRAYIKDAEKIIANKKAGKLY